MRSRSDRGPRAFAIVRVAVSVLAVVLGSASVQANAQSSAPSPATSTSPAPPPAAAAPAISKPAETADAVLHAENVAWGRRLHDALRLPAWLDLAVDHRTRFEFMDDPWRPGESQKQTQLPQRTRVRVGLDAPAGVRFLVEFQDARVFGDRPNDFVLLQVDHFDVTQLFVSATAKDLGGRGLRLDAHVGRLSLDLASRRLLARNEFRNTTNAFDGVHLQLGSDARRWRVRAFYTLPVELQTGDVLDDKVSARRRFGGLAFEDLRNPWILLDAYGLFLDDLPGNRTLRTYGLRAYRRPAPAQIDYEGELAGQFGERRTASEDHDQSAWMAHAELGYTLAVAWTPRLAFQLDYASGSDDPSDDDSHTFDVYFGARRFDLNPTGIFGAFRRTNIVSPGVRVGLLPAKTLRLDAKVRYWMLDEARDAFSGNGLTDASGDAGRDLGTDLELRARWDPFEWLGFDVGYVHWWKGEYLDEVANARTRGDADYFYAHSRVRF